MVGPLGQAADGRLPGGHGRARVVELALLAEERVGLHVQGQVAELTWWSRWGPAQTRGEGREE